MAPDTFEAMDLTDLAELIDDEDCDSESSERAAAEVRAATDPGENAVA